VDFLVVRNRGSWILRGLQESLPMLELSLLGDPSATLDGQVLSESLLNKNLGLLYYLAVCDQPQSRVALAVLLWGDLSEAAARGNLRKSLSDLRQRLGDHLAIERDHVALVQTHATVDIWEFERLARNGLATSNPAQLQAAADLYRGDFLAGFNVRNAPDYDRWVYNMQEQLRALAVHVLATLASHYAAGGEFLPAIATQRRVLELEPWREESHRDLMVLLARSGQRNAALAQYKLCVQGWAAELGGSPSAETTALAEQIRESDATQEMSQLLPKPVATLTYANLPSELAPIVGRAQELQELSDMLLGADCRLVTILGIGGIGKPQPTQYPYRYDVCA
jgi:DNA-binding SARP family transcriptional activator